jgi:hypothetical protein
MYSLFDSPTARGRRAQTSTLQQHVSRKRSLVIALNYWNSNPQLQHQECARALRKAFALNLHVTDVQLVEDSVTKGVSKHEVLQAIDTLLAGCHAGDVLFFHLVGRSFENGFLLTDESISFDEIKSSVVEPLPIGVTLLCVLDCQTSKGMNMRYVFTDESLGPKTSIPCDGRRISNCIEKWKQNCKEEENVEAADTAASVVVLRQASSAGLLSWCLSKCLDDVYPHSLPLAQVLMHVRAHSFANGEHAPPILESGQHMDARVPIGRLVSAPI